MSVRWEWLSDHDWVEYRDVEAIHLEEAYQDGFESLLILNKYVFQRTVYALDDFPSN